MKLFKIPTSLSWVLDHVLNYNLFGVHALMLEHVALY